ncbi:hypothetical protein A9Q99_00645 [Gammaproteobacteria bacterium 45_16_T64]|nr:hypothetical protein A9Q99_00645 [Gammaproteobacteria bacterium 45_16_T64]
MKKNSLPIQYQHYLPARFYSELPELVLELGIDLKILLKDTGLNKQQLKDVCTKEAPKITRGPSEKLILNLLALTKDPAMGFTVGERYNISSHGAVGFAALTCNNVANALDIATKYFPVLTPLLRLKVPTLATDNSSTITNTGDERNSLSLENSESLRIIEVESSADMHPEVERFLIEGILSSIHVMAQFLLNNKLPAYILELAYPLQGYHQTYADKKNIHITGDHKQTRILFPSELLSQPLLLADKNAFQKNLEECDYLLEGSMSRQATLIQSISNQLSEPDNLFLSQEFIADKLNMSSRTLQRLLKKENTNFRDIANHVRISQAKRLLVESEYSISQVAHELGYTDAANFTRAFKKLENISPSEYRDSKINPS